VLTGSCYRLIKEDVADVASEFIEEFLVKVQEDGIVVGSCSGPEMREEIRFVIGQRLRGFMTLPWTMILVGRG
jgi:hypothetical protein